MNSKTTNDSPRTAEIWMCWLENKDGSIQSGYRPVYIASNDMNNRYSTTLNVIPITSKRKKPLPVHVELDRYQEYGLSIQSTMLVEQIMTVSADKLHKRVGRIMDLETLRKISDALAVQIPVFVSNAA